MLILSDIQRIELTTWLLTYGMDWVELWTVPDGEYHNTILGRHVLANQFFDYRFDSDGVGESFKLKQKTLEALNDGN